MKEIKLLGLCSIHIYVVKLVNYFKNIGLLNLLNLHKIIFL